MFPPFGPSANAPKPEPGTGDAPPAGEEEEKKKQKRGLLSDGDEENDSESVVLKLSELIMFVLIKILSCSYLTTMFVSYQLILIIISRNV